jgi:hypothetical protein
MKRGGGRNGRRMRCGAWDIDSMAGEVGALVEGSESRWRRCSSVLAEGGRRGKGWPCEEARPEGRARPAGPFGPDEQGKGVFYSGNYF